MIEFFTKPHYEWTFIDDLYCALLVILMVVVAVGLFFLLCWIVSVIRRVCFKRKNDKFCREQYRVVTTKNVTLDDLKGRKSGETDSHID